MPTATAEVAFTVTPRIQQALQRLLDNKAKLRAEQQPQLETLPATTSPSITLSQLQHLSSLLLTLPLQPTTTTTPPTTPTTTPTHLHDLLSTSSLYTPPPPPRKRDPAFLAFLARQRIKQSQRDYLALVADLPGNTELARTVHATSIATTPTDPSDYAGGFGRAMGREMGEGINVLTLMVTGFVIGWYGAGMVWQHSTLAPVVGGLIGLVSAMLMEVTLLMLRDRRGEEVQQKRRHEQRVKDEQRIAVKRVKDKEAAMKRHMDEMAQQHVQPAAEGEAESAVEGTDVDAVTTAEDGGMGIGAAATSLRKRKGK